MGPELAARAKPGLAEAPGGLAKTRDATCAYARAMSEYDPGPEIAPIIGPISADRARALMLNGVMLMALPSIPAIWVAASLARRFLKVGGAQLIHEAVERPNLLNGFVLIFGGVGFFNLGWKLFHQGRTAPRA